VRVRLAAAIDKTGSISPQVGIALNGGARIPHGFENIEVMKQRLLRMPKDQNDLHRAFFGNHFDAT
jgi:hypothetical protein